MNDNAGVAWTMSDRLGEMGGISLWRVRLDPPPGTATLTDMLAANDSGNGRFELVDATLVEKPMGWRESLIAAVLIEWIGQFVRTRNLGVVTGPDGFFRILDSLARGPDVTFISWHRLPDGRIPDEAVPKLAPDLAVEVLSEGNTSAEMGRKRREYFQAGVRLVWMVDPRERTVAVYRSIVNYEVFREDQSLTGGDVLPGFEIRLADLFGELDRTAPPQ